MAAGGGVATSVGFEQGRSVHCCCSLLFARGLDAALYMSTRLYGGEPPHLRGTSDRRVHFDLLRPSVRTAPPTWRSSQNWALLRLAPCPIASGGTVVAGSGPGTRYVQVAPLCHAPPQTHAAVPLLKSHELCTPKGQHKVGNTDCVTQTVLHSALLRTCLARQLIYGQLLAAADTACYAALVVHAAGPSTFRNSELWKQPHVSLANLTQQELHSDLSAKAADM